MTDTPRTDALADRMASEPELEAFARTLERELAAAQAERDEARKLILDHNSACEALCGETEADKGVRCKYRPYFPRRCPECPADNWKLDTPWLAQEKGHD